MTALGKSKILGIELTDGEAQLRPKVKIEGRQIDVQGGFWIAVFPEEEGDQIFGLEVDGHSAKIKQNEYQMGTTWNASQIGKVMPFKVNYPRFVKQNDSEPEINPYAKGTHRIQIKSGHMVGGFPIWDEFSLPYYVTITESEF